MKLLTKGIDKRLSNFPIGSQDGKGKDAEVVVKFFDPCGAGTWLITEGEKTPNGDWLLFGYVTLGYEWEWGYVMLSELERIRNWLGLGIERDMYTGTKKTIRDFMK